MEDLLLVCSNFQLPVSIDLHKQHKLNLAYWKLDIFVTLQFKININQEWK